jgi:hypothetical protein
MWGRVRSVQFCLYGFLPEKCAFVDIPLFSITKVIPAILVLVLKPVQCTKSSVSPLPGILRFRFWGHVLLNTCTNLRNILWELLQGVGRRNHLLSQSIGFAFQASMTYWSAEYFCENWTGQQNVSTAIQPFVTFFILLCNGTSQNHIKNHTNLPEHS